jgi:hypothetical protein
MRLVEILQEAMFPGGDIGNMAASNIPSREEDDNAPAKEDEARLQNSKRRQIRKRIAKVKNRNKPWTKEERMDASPSTAEHDLGQTDAALAGVMNGKNPYPGHQGI